MDPNEISLLECSLAGLDKAIAELVLRLAACPPHGAHYNDFRRQEAEHERRDLLQQRGQTARKLAEARTVVKREFRFIRRRDKQPDEQTRRRIATLDALERESRASTQAFINKLEAQGDYRQARLHRAQLLNVRAVLAQAYGIVE